MNAVRKDKTITFGDGSVKRFASINKAKLRMREEPQHRSGQRTSDKGRKRAPSPEKLLKRRAKA